MKEAKQELDAADAEILKGILLVESALNAAGIEEASWVKVPTHGTLHWRAKTGSASQWGELVFDTQEFEHGGKPRPLADYDKETRALVAPHLPMLVNSLGMILRQELTRREKAKAAIQDALRKLRTSEEGTSEPGILYSLLIPTHKKELCWKKVAGLKLCRLAKGHEGGCDEDGDLPPSPKDIFGKFEVLEWRIARALACLNDNEDALVFAFNAESYLKGALDSRITHCGKIVSPFGMTEFCVRSPGHEGKCSQNAGV